jgi:hypothetical protein
VAILEDFLRKEGWRPRRVKLFMFAISSILMPGNDFYDNLIDSQKLSGDRNPIEHETSSSTYQDMFDLRKMLLRNSNLARLIKYYFGPWLRAKVYPKAQRTSLAEALDLTRAALARLDQMSHTYGFAYDIYLLHPMQDILSGTDGATLETVRQLVPNVPVKETAQLFRDNPVSYYYRYDAHLNPRGSEKVAEFLIAENGS